MFDLLYVLSNMDLFIVAFNSAMVDLGISILKAVKNIKFPSLPMFIFMQYLFFF